MDNNIVEVKDFPALIKAFTEWEKDKQNVFLLHNFIGLIPDCIYEIFYEADEVSDCIIQDIESMLRAAAQYLTEHPPGNAEHMAVTGCALLIIEYNHYSFDNIMEAGKGLIDKALSLEPYNDFIRLIYSEHSDMDLAPKDNFNKKIEEIKLRLKETKRLLLYGNSSNPVERMVANWFLTPVYYAWNITTTCMYYITARQLSMGLIDEDDCRALVSIIKEKENARGNTNSYANANDMNEDISMDINTISDFTPGFDADMEHFIQNFIYSCITENATEERDVKHAAQKLCEDVESLVFQPVQTLSLVEDNSTYSTIKRSVYYHCISMVNLGRDYDEIITTAKSNILDRLPEKYKPTFWIDLGKILIQVFGYAEKNEIRRIDFATYSQNELWNWKSFSKAIKKARKLEIKELKSSVIYYKNRYRGIDNHLGCMIIGGTPAALTLFTLVTAFITKRVFSFEWFIACCGIYMGILGVYGSIDQIPMYGWSKWVKGTMLAFTILSAVLFIAAGIFLMGSVIAG